MENGVGRVSHISFRVVSIAVLIVVVLGIVIWVNVVTWDTPDDDETDGDSQTFSM